MDTTNEIPQEVLVDYTKRTIVEVKNPKWATEDRSMVECEVLFAELEPLGYIPFAASATTDTEHGLEVWRMVIEGECGDIEPYDPSRFFESFSIASIWSSFTDSEAEAFDEAMSGATPLRLRRVFETSQTIETGTEVFEFVRNVMATAIGEKRTKEILT